MYGVGGKDGDRKRTGFAHFFEHLLFEGTANIKKGNGLKLSLPMEEGTTQTLLKTEPIIMKYFLLTN
jgi:predicted Zn-dependent peptidase